MRSAAGALIEAGVGAGDRVALWAPNTPEWAMASLAVLFAGGSVVPINTRYTAVEAAALVSRADCRVVLAAGELGGRSPAKEAAAMPGPITVVSLGPTAVPGLTPWGEFAPVRSSNAALDRRLAALTPGHVSHVQYTSGTTGAPKGAMLRHGAMVETTARWAEVVGLTEGDCYPVVSPFSHIGGHKTGLLACLVTGATTVPVAAFDPAGFERIVAERGVTVVQGPPTLFHALVERAKEGVDTLRTMRVGVTGAAVIPPTLVRDMLHVLGLQVVVTAYGLTETTGVCTMTRPGDPVGVVAETSGRPIEGVDVQIVDESGVPLSPGSRGRNRRAGHRSHGRVPR